MSYGVEVTISFGDLLMATRTALRLVVNGNSFRQLDPLRR